jgi:Ser/Thr protein kinase RdoA (MazF antagonist)
MHNTDQNTTRLPHLAFISSHFMFEGEFISAQPYGFGHINDTYLVACNSRTGRTLHYILQRINHHVFKDPHAVMQNLVKVTEHLQKKILQAGGDPKRQTITLLPTKEGNSYLKMPTGEFWRAEVFIEGAQTYQVPTNPAHYYHAAWAFGNFSQMLSDFPVSELCVTIPDFHNTPKRFSAFIDSLNRDPLNRAAQVRPEIDFLLHRENDIHILVDLASQGRLPLRVTHNDTKFENVMIDDQTGKGICIIDLDTVMPGWIVFDFGDAVRSGANPAAEDEPDLSKVCFQFEVFRHLAQGYLDASRSFLNSTESSQLAFASRLITLEQAIRFLTDHINGDVYYRIHRRDHNLDRCRTQIKMVYEMENQFERMVECVNEIQNATSSAI